MVDFEFLEHTADIAVKVKANTLNDLFTDTAKVMFHLITDYQPTSSNKRKIYLKSETMEDLLIYWLNELLSLFYTYNFLPAGYNINLDKKKMCFLKGEVYGEYCSELNINTEVKAATYHNVNIEKKNGKFKVEIVFDV